MRRGAAALVLAAGSAAAAVLWRRSRTSRTHVDLYYTDGSMVSLSAGSPEAERLLPLAREVLVAARGDA